MPAGLPGDSYVNNHGNPNAGNFVIFDPLSGPKGSPLDSDPGQTHCSTGALSTGIGISAEDIISTPNLGPQGVPGTTAPNQIWRAGFNDNNIPGEVDTYSAGGPPPVVASSAINSTRMYIGGGRSAANNANPGTGYVAPNPYTQGIAICGAGNGGSRDSGTGTGFPLKMVTATGTVANGADVEAGFTNRSGVSLTTGQSTFGSTDAPLAAAA